MSTLTKKLLKKTGASPGTLVHVGEIKTADTRLKIVNYSESGLDEVELRSIEEAISRIESDKNTWMTLTGLHNVSLIEKIGKEFNIHPLILEDILNTNQRPKIEFFENYLFIVTKLPLYDDNQVSTEQISIILGRDYLLLFEERLTDVFKPVIERLKVGKGRIRKQGCDYLAYALIDVVVDSCFPILESLGDKIEMIEGNLTADPPAETISELHTLKREIIQLRKLLWPMREIIGRMKREDFDFVSDTTRIFLNDVNDHAIQILDTIESYKDILSGLSELYLSLVSNKTNEAMKILTIIATIFIPMTFIVGIYGMNFKFMPELDWQWGYFFVWVLIVIVAIAMIIWFKRKKLI